MNPNNTQLFRKQGQSQVVDTQGNLVPFSGNLDTLPVYNQQNNVITPDALSPKTKIDLSGIYPTQPTGDGLVTGAVDSTKAFDTEAAYKKELELQKLTKPDSTELDSYLKGLIGAEQGLTGRGAAQSEAEIAAGIPEAQKARSSIQGRLKVMLAEYDAMKKERDQVISNIEEGAGRKGLTTGAVMGQVGAQERQYLARLNSKASEIGIQQAQDEALKGDIDTAQKIVNRAIDLKYQDKEAEYTAWKNGYDRVKGTFDAEEKKRGEALAAAKAKEEKALAERKEEEKSIQSVMLEAVKNGAGSDIVNAISKAKTFEEALKVGGNALATTSSDIVKLDNGNTVVVDKRTGRIINNLGGGKGTNPSVTVRKVAGVPVTGYTLVAGDDPYFIAQQNGISVAELKKLNPNVKDWNNIQPGATLNVPQPEQDAFLTYLKSTEGGKNLTDTSIQKLDKGLTVLNQLGVLQSNVNGVKTGPLLGAFRSRNPWDTQAQTIKTSLNAIVPNLARGVYGEVGVLTDNDIKTYSQTIPNLSSTEEIRNAVLYITLDMIGKSIKNTLNVNAAAGRDVSGFSDIYTEMESTKNSILSSIPNAQVPQAFQQQDEFLSQFSPQGVNSNISNSAFFNQLP